MTLLHLHVRFLLFRISPTTTIGSIIGKVRAVAGRQVVQYRISDKRFDVDSWGNVILIEELTSAGSHEFLVMATTPHRNVTAVQKVTIDMAKVDYSGEEVFRVKVRARQ